MQPRLTVNVNLIYIDQPLRFEQESNSRHSFREYKKNRIGYADAIFGELRETLFSANEKTEISIAVESYVAKYRQQFRSCAALAIQSASAINATVMPYALRFYLYLFVAGVVVVVLAVWLALSACWSI